MERLLVHPLVAEVVVINNSPIPLPLKTDKLRVVQPGRNLFVNASWNEGVRLAQSPFIAICNDDILFPDELLSPVHRVLQFPVGIIGPSNVCFKGVWAENPAPRFRPTYERPSGFGTLMFLRRDYYVNIPEEMRIWFGDDWLFESQRHRNIAFHGVDIETPMSVTSSASEFAGIFDEDEAAFAKARNGLEPRWRREKSIYESARTAARRIRTMGS